MKKYVLLLACAALLIACDKTDRIREISVSVQITTPEGVTVPDAYKVEFINYDENIKVEKTAGADGTVTAGILPGIYTISVSAEVLEQGFSTIYSGSLVNKGIITEGASYTIAVQTAKSGTLVFKELYYAGCRTPSNATYFRDQFYEIYNNSESVVYADGMCIGTLLPLTATANLPTWDISNPDDYVFFGNIWQLPGNGTDYPLQPGESIIIAQWATNHQVANLNPASPVNLTSGEFEAFVATTAILTDEPALNMTWIFHAANTTPQWLTSVFGSAFAIFFPDETVDFGTFVTQVGSTAKGKEIPVAMILDAVETVDNETKIQLKRIPTVLDAGATFVSATYNGKSVARKIKDTAAGRNTYQDTNNSTNDFEVQDTPEIRRHGAQKPAWNTWGN